MEKNEITLFCVNDGKNHKIEKGKSLKDLADKCCKCVTDKKTGQKSDVLAALVDNKLKELSFKPVNLHQVEFIGYNHPDEVTCARSASCCRTPSGNSILTRCW